MGIKHKVDGVPIEDVFEGYFTEHVDPATVVQVKVSCQGDIAVQCFYPEDCDGVAWLLLSQGPKGEVGRDINGEVDEGPRLLSEQPGVFIGAIDPESLTVIIEALETLRDKLAARSATGMAEAEQGKGLQDIATRDDLKAVRSVEEALRPDHPIGAAIGDAISRDIDQMFIDALHEDEKAEPSKDPPQKAAKNKVPR